MLASPAPIANAQVFAPTPKQQKATPFSFAAHAICFRKITSPDHLPFELRSLALFPFGGFLQHLPPHLLWPTLRYPLWRIRLFQDRATRLQSGHQPLSLQAFPLRIPFSSLQMAELTLPLSLQASLLLRPPSNFSNHPKSSILKSQFLSTHRFLLVLTAVLPPLQLLTEVLILLPTADLVSRIMTTPYHLL